MTWVSVCGVLLSNTSVMPATAASVLDGAHSLEVGRRGDRSRVLPYADGMSVPEADAHAGPLP